ncbi:unnamed protein product [Linum tenue]|uniref:Uncharacterized protein n=1 Tax=Linum tenue TaxID=586396 RepID=A0AAV0M928_9ROSI|nr:unnamed protein product [Linum tenue]
MASSISSFLCSKLFTTLILTFILLPFVPHSSSSSSSSSQVDHYIVFMDSNAMPKVFATARHWHLAILASLTAAPDNHQVASSKLIHSYSHVIDGFSCTLTSSELDALRNSDGYLHSIKDVPVKPYTTHSVEFLGLRGSGGCSASAAWEASNYGEGMIIGSIDSGVWPESRSFGDHGMGPVPARWRGECAQFNASLCNKKLIGARSFHQGLDARNITIGKNSSARDDTGHGTHTASTAAGNFVPGASFFGYAPGVAKGVAPRAHVAIYKVFHQDKGVASDVTKAIDQAIEDGVDVLSMSLGPKEVATSLYDDPVAIATFAAMEKNVFVAIAAGNGGPTPKSLSNSSPWTLVVAAGSIDREFRAELHLGNRGVSVSGLSLYPGSYLSAQAPIVFMGDCLNETATAGEALKGKIVVCQHKNQMLGYQLSNIQNSSAVGAVFIGLDAELLRVYVEDNHMKTWLPAMFMTLEEGEAVKKYIKSSSSSSSKNPRVASLRFGITNLNRRPAPMVAGYSSRGPSPASPYVLKPDIMGPGSLILAAWPPTVEVATVTDSNPPFYSTLYSD